MNDAVRQLSILGFVHEKKPRLRPGRRLLWVALFLSMTGRSPAESDRSMTIALVGDSTVTDNAGWGKAFAKMTAPGVQVLNLAKGGTSTKSYRDGGRWEKALREDADFMLIQFGHNDRPGKGPHRETDAATTYRENLDRFVDEARAAGIQPVLVTSVAVRKFGPDGKIVDDLAPYAIAMRAVAAEKQVPLIDLHQRSIEGLERLGPAASEEFGPMKDGRRDITHFSDEGATFAARLVVGEFVRVVPTAAALFKNQQP